MSNDLFYTNNINSQFIETFFINKKVSLQQELFSTYYYDIFPCPQSFIDFLSASNREQQTVSAKKIINRIYFCNYNSILSDLYRKLIELEEHELLEEDANYIPRDHSVHSINTYLLGVYLYFSLETFNNQLRNQFSHNSFYGIYNSQQKNDNTFLSFLDSWKLFSLYHDIGYPLEVLISKDNLYKSKNGNKILSSLNGISDYLKAEFTVYNILFCVTSYILCKTSNKDFSEKYSYFSKTSKKIYHDLEKTLLLKDYVRLEGIYTYESIQFIIEKLDKTKLFCFVNNNEHDFNYFVPRNVKTSIKNCLGNIDSIATELPPYSSVEFYYPKQLLDQLFKKIMKTNSQHEDDIIVFADKVLEENTIYYAGITNHQRYMDFLYSIYTEIKEQIKNKSLNKFLVDDSYYEIKYNALVELVIDDLCNYLDNNKEIDTTVSVESTSKDNIDKLLTTYIMNGNQKAVFNSFFSRQDEENRDLLFAYKTFFNKLASHITNSEDSNFNNNLIWNISSKKFTYIKPRYVNKQFQMEFQKTLDMFSNIALDSQIICEKTNIELMKKYNTDYYMFDHGVSSAYILLEANYKAQTMAKSPQSVFSLKKLLIPDSVFINSCYSIFIHNMYVDYFNNLPQSTKSVKHNILKNPFVYFSLFCDNMQIWDRPFSVSHGNVDLRIPSISHEDVSIEIFDNKIHLQFKSHQIENIIYNYRKGLDEYLKDASKLIVLGITEE